MNLVTRFLAARRDKLLMRLGCWLVCFSLVLGLMLPQQRAEALVAELSMTAVASLAAAYLGACGLSFVTQGMDKDALVSSVQRLIQEFLDTELGGISIQDWLGNVWDLAVIAGKLIMGRPLTEEFVSFAQWVAGKYAVQVGVNVVSSTKGFTSADGSFYTLGAAKPGELILGTNLLPAPGSIQVTNDFLVTFSVIPGKHGGSSTSISGLYAYINGDLAGSIFYEDSRQIISDLCFTVNGSYVSLLGFYSSGNEIIGYSGISLTPPLSSSGLSITDVDLSIERKKERPIYFPEGLGVGQGVALDTGAAATMDLDQVLQGVLDGVLEGTLTSTMEIAEEAVVDPPAGEITDVDNLGLPVLGQALTSRFPFSIPWDFFRAVQLLAAPAKAPRFEVDFMQPIEHRVGQWQGDTKVVLDFSEYAIIGQISRWTSTIGFCLMLVGATKRLIWTA